MSKIKSIVTNIFSCLSVQLVISGMLKSEIEFVDGLCNGWSMVHCTSFNLDFDGIFEFFTRINESLDRS